MSTPYAVVPLNASVPHTLTPIIGQGTRVVSVTVISVPIGVVGYIRIGQNGDQIPVRESLQLDCIDTIDGIFYDQPLASSGNVVVVWFGAGSAQLGA